MISPLNSVDPSHSYGVLFSQCEIHDTWRIYRDDVFKSGCEKNAVILPLFPVPLNQPIQWYMYYNYTIYIYIYINIY